MPPSLCLCSIIHALARSRRGPPLLGTLEVTLSSITQNAQVPRVGCEHFSAACLSAFYTTVHFSLCLTGLEILNISHNLWLPDVIILARSGEGQTLVVVTVLLQSVS